MKNLIIVIVLFFMQHIVAQEKKVTLKECILMALSNKSSILALKTEQTISDLNTKQQKSAYNTQVSVAYDYIYNPIIRSSIVPVGRFSQVPTDETRAIKFGTNYQQNLGLKVYQPLFDATIKSKIQESKIQEKIKNAEINTANNELAIEVSKTFITVLLNEQRAKSSVYDTLRTSQTLSVAKNNYLNGRILKTEFNKAKINHNNSVTVFNEIKNEIVNQRIYLSFLSKLPVDVQLIKDKNIAFSEDFSQITKSESGTDSLSEVQLLKSQISYENQKIKTLKNNYFPVIGLNGYVGADQFSNTLNPLQKDSWFGNSFVGLSVKLPVLIGQNFKNNVNQQQLKVKSLEYQIKSSTEEADKNKLFAENNLNKIKKEIKNSETNILLYKESLQIFQERLKEGQQTVSEVNNEEFDYNKEIENLSILKNNLFIQVIDYLKNSGLINRIYE